MFNEFFINAGAAKEIAERHKHKDYRPTVVGLIRNQDRFLITTTNHGNQFLLQGGINPDEPLTRALRREAKEELNLTDIRNVARVWTAQVPYLPNRARRDGFVSGKEYYVCAAETRQNQLRVDGREIWQANFVDIVRLAQICQGMEVEKAGLVVNALIRLNYQIRGEDFHKDLKGGWLEYYASNS